MRKKFILAGGNGTLQVVRFYDHIVNIWHLIINNQFHEMKGKNKVLLGMFLGTCLLGCGPDLPFTAEYTSPNQVIIQYQGKQYTLERYGIPASVPFSYRFEEDGDLDLTINGKLYEVESPYDRDKKKIKKKVKKKTVKKKSADKKKR